MHDGGAVQDRGTARPARQRVGAVVAVVLATAVLLGCESVTVDRINDVRSMHGRDALASSPVLQGAARDRSATMCAAGTVTPSPDPVEAYDQETAAALHELVGSAPLDPAIETWGRRNGTASNEIWAAWRDDPALADARWDDIAVGEHECADGKLYMTAVLRDRPTVPASGMYASIQHTSSQIRIDRGLEYGSAIGYQGTSEDLLLDLYRPPGTVTGGRPTLVLIHGGAFAGGDRSNLGGVAMSWAVRGYNVASISYRLDPRLAMSPRPPGVTVIGAAAKAIDDGMESIRWLKLNAATYNIDATRIATIGYSAGGAVSLGIALIDDMTPGGPLASFSPTVAAAISTGAQLTDGIDAGLVTFQPTDAPVLMFHYETDAASGTGDFAMRTCGGQRAGGSTCDFVLQPGDGHTTDLDPGQRWWPTMGPFLWTHLRLGTP